MKWFGQILCTEYKEEIEDGKVLRFCRNAIFQARIYKCNRQYIYKFLKLVRSKRLENRHSSLSAAAG